MTQTRKNGWIDISVPIHNRMAHWPDQPDVNIRLLASMAKGAVCNVSLIEFCAHTGTHMDSPRHFIRAGKPMEHWPPDATLGPCRVIEVKDNVSIKPEHLAPHKLKRGERILFKTPNSTRSWKKKNFDKNFVYISKEAAQHIVDRGVMTVGVDYLSVGGFYKDGIETHHVLLGAEVWIIEGLNLAKIRPGAYELACLPLHIPGCDGAPARALLRKR